MSDIKKKPKVYFFVGPEKTGTTTIFDLLPFKTIPKQKEMYNLSRKCNIKAETNRINAQVNKSNSAYIVEPTYFISKLARQAIRDFSDDYEVHVIHTRRDPIKRMFSHYLHHKSKGRIRHPEETKSKFPEVFESSRYDKYSELWKLSVVNFHVIDIADTTDLSQSLLDIGIEPVDSKFMQSNRRLAPRNIAVARFATKIWQFIISLGINKVIPVKIKEIIKSNVYYGGKKVEISDEERQCLTKVLSNID